MPSKQAEIPTIAPALVQPGMVARLSINLGEQDRILQFETYFDRDENQTEINHRLDQMQKAADRKRAQHLLPSYRRNREDVEHKTNENRRRLAGVEAMLRESDKIRSEKLVELDTGLAVVIGGLRDAWYASGKRGEFKEPRTKDTAHYQTQIDALEAGATKERNEAQVQIAELQNEIKDGERALAKWDVLIAEHEALIRDGEVVG
jgi:hypothetical protein